MKYCPVCGASTKQINKTKYQCTGCGREHYLTPRPCVSVVLLQGGNILLARRAHEPYKGMFDTLGGFLDADEDFETAAYRELQEEVGLTKGDIGSLEYVGSCHEVYPWQGQDLSVAVVYFTAELRPDVTFKPSDDVADIETFKRGEIASVNIAFPNMRALLLGL